MSDASNSGRRAKASKSDTGVLANLPRTRPQRSSPRRAAARKAASVPRAAAAEDAPGASASVGATRKASSKAPKKTSAKTQRSVGATAGAEAVPRQGYEADGEIASGSVQPPGATEFVSSAAELAGELAKAGVSGGARLLKDLFARLPPG